MIATLKLVVEYDGAGFEGWQRQPEGHRTVQAELERALSALGRLQRLMGAGRTDAGVHAEGQVASVEIETRLDAATLGRALNAKLPRDIAVPVCRAVAAGFDARRDALRKHYRYRVWNGPLRSPLRADRALHVREALDTAALRRALTHLEGRHDFAAFQGVGTPVPHTVRTLSRAALSGGAGAELAFDFAGDGFLRHMVRNLVGTLLEVGRGRRDPDSLPLLIASRDRGQAGPTARPEGLTLVAVEYPAPFAEPGECP